ncbi:MAG: hypothetical protein JXN61_00375, partial [Sedimentisphaerales bacterium]|nr:hypothetical protein [Sedimentisphaerales bacterium]
MNPRRFAFMIRFLQSQFLCVAGSSHYTGSTQQFKEGDESEAQLLQTRPITGGVQFTRRSYARNPE